MTTVRKNMRRCIGCDQPFDHKKGVNHCPACMEKFAAEDRSTQQKLREQVNATYRAQNEREKFLLRLESIQARLISVFDTSITKGTNLPHSAELMESIYECVGGVSNFAKLLWADYFTMPVEKRFRILELIAKLTLKNTEQGGAKKPLDLYSEDELEKELNERIDQHFLRISHKPEGGEDEQKTGT